MSFTALASLDALQALAALPLKRLRLRCIGADLRCAKGLALGLAHARWGISAPFMACFDAWLDPEKVHYRGFRCDRIVSLELWLVSLSGARSVGVMGAARTRTARGAEPEPAEP